MKKIWEWLSDFGSHEIYTASKCAEDFIKETGEEPCWPVHTAQATRNAIRARGLGGNLEGEEDCATGHEIAEALARKYANFRSEKHGRGRRFYECLEALKNADK